jgi:excisionase family DNA binding protein
MNMKQVVLSIREAAERLSISQQHARYLLAKGDIKGKKLGHDWVVLSLDYKRKRRSKRRVQQ